MKEYRNLIILLLLLFDVMPATAQQLQKFSVVSFELDQFDLTAKNEQYKKVDGNGALYAIIKVKSNNPNYDLKAYMFNFGNLNSFLEMHEGELWVYVQRNAKIVTISRQGYTTINKYDLKTTIEAGKTYTMELSTKAQPVQMQMVMFVVNPPAERTMITVKGSNQDAIEEVLGMTDENGALAKNMALGIYTYKVASEGYYPTEGRFVLDDKTKTHKETVNLRPRFSVTSLTVDSDADIYVNGEYKGKRTWNGRLNAGSYFVECRQLNHRSTTQNITVGEGNENSFKLTPPTPITGVLSVLSQPLGASISIDGKDYGETPQNINGLLIGQHNVKLSKQGYSDEETTTVITEDDVTELNISLVKGQSTHTVVVDNTKNERSSTINNIGEKENLYKKHKQTSNILKWVGYGGGVGLVGAGVLLLALDGTSSATGKADPKIHAGSYALMGGGVVWTIGFQYLSYSENKKAKRSYQNNTCAACKVKFIAQN